ncbi:MULTISPECIES: hypothetical protein [Burkholderia]|nr:MULTISPECIES: hypothetical protein [Burkholderia]
MKSDTESNQARIVGQQMQTVGQAVDTYIANRYTPISQLQNAAGGAGDPGPRTCSGTTCAIMIQTLVNEGLLPATHQNPNSFGARYNITLSVSGTSPNWDVTGLVATPQPWPSQCRADRRLRRRLERTDHNRAIAGPTGLSGRHGDQPLFSLPAPGRLLANDRWPEHVGRHHSQHQQRRQYHRHGAISIHPGRHQLR